jgi:carbamoylphosphate synthase large subunit
MRNADKIRAAAAAAPAVAPAKRYLHSRELEKIITKEVEEAVMRALGIAGPGEFASRLKTAGLVREYSVK